jgi:hypothetical protein
MNCCMRINIVIFLRACIVVTEGKKNVKLSCEQSVSSDEEENIGDNCSMWHGIWTKSGVERLFHLLIY